jgi:hypothetical protein
MHENGGRSCNVESHISRPARHAHTFAVLSLVIFTERSDLVLTLSEINECEMIRLE